MNSYYKFRLTDLIKNYSKLIFSFNKLILFSKIQKQSACLASPNYGGRGWCYENPYSSSLATSLGFFVVFDFNHYQHLWLFCDWQFCVLSGNHGHKVNNTNLHFGCGQIMYNSASSPSVCVDVSPGTMWFCLILNKLKCKFLS